MTSPQNPTGGAPSAPTRKGLEGALIDALDLYFEQLGNQKPHALYEMVIVAMERPLLHYALDRCEGNITKTSALLGLTRNTLRKKIARHQIQLSQPES
jgi:Fis family transcriptional regulator, factor for inversion stimulation protein